MSFGLRIISEVDSYCVGLNLGQSRNHSALAVVERAELLLDEMDWVTYERRREWRYRMRFLERVPLGTPYPDVAARVREVVRNEAIARLCGGFCFAALLYYIRCRSYARLNLRQSSLFVALYIGALDSKEMAVSLPVIVLAYELLFGVPRPFKLSAIRSGVTANAGLALAATAITAVFIFGKTHGPDAMTRMWAYRPVFTWSRFAESNTRFLNELFHTDRFTIQGVILIWTALLCAALLGRDRRLILLWTWVMVTPLPITFLPHRGGAMLYLVLAGWSMAAAILCEALARLIARTLALHRTPSSVLVTCLLAAAAGLYVKETIRLHEGREAAFLRFGDRTWDLIQQFRAFPVHPTHGARILFLNDPFLDLQNPWHTLFVAALSWNDRSLTVWLQSQAHFMESDISRMDYVFRFTAGRLELLSVKAR